MPQRKKRVLIVGGGMGGLALASFLEQKGIDYLVIEKNKKLWTFGYVLALYPTGINILRRLNLEKKTNSGIRKNIRVRNKRNRRRRITKIQL